MEASEATAAAFLERLDALKSDAEREKYRRYFKSGIGEPGAGDHFIGVRMGQVFGLAKEFIDMAPAEMERLLESDIHEARAGALSIMEKQFRRKKTADSRRAELFELYLRRHDRINNWDLVDLAAHHVVGAWLADKERGVLYELAKSANPWERRTALVATFAFVRRGELDDAYAIAGMTLQDPEDLVNKATGWVLRTADGVDRERLLRFLGEHAAVMPRTTLNAAMEHFPAELKARYR